MFLLKYFKGFLVIQCTHLLCTHYIRLTCTVQRIILAINIWGVKCDKVVDFPKSSHKYAKVCMTDEKQKKKMKKLSQFSKVHILKHLSWNLEYEVMKMALQKWFGFIEVSWGYIYVKITLLFFMLITHGCGMLAWLLGPHYTLPCMFIYVTRVAKRYLFHTFTCMQDCYMQWVKHYEVQKMGQN